MKKTLGLVFIFILLLALSSTKAFAQGQFLCEWGVGCHATLSRGYTCEVGYTHDDSLCTIHTDPNSCNSDINDCVSVQPPQSEYCYECVDTITGCIPRDVTDSRCEYKARTQSAALSTCKAACTGQVPTRFNCANKQCIEASSGTYASLGDCAQACMSLEPSDPTCDDKTGISTAIGCIHVLAGQEAFLGDILKWAVGVGGGIAFLLIVYASFMIMTSAGNPERLKAGQELLTSAISGLILLIFSVFILKFIGVDILGLGKFGFGK